MTALSTQQGALGLVNYWRPTTWDQAEEVPETDPLAIMRGWAPEAHGVHDDGFAMQERDLRILARLWAAGGLMTEHVQALYFPEVRSPRAVRNRMLKLWRVGLVRRYRPQLSEARGTGSYLFTLTQLGLDVLHEARHPWWVTRYPLAAWDPRQQDRPPSFDLMHPLMVADIASWAESRLKREWVHESEPAGRVLVHGAGGRAAGDSFFPDAILDDRRGGTSAWFLEVERRAYAPHWREKTAKWATWAAQYAFGQAPAVFVVAGYLRDAPDRIHRGILPLLEETPDALRPLVHVLDLEAWDRTSDAPQMAPVADVLG